MAPVAPGSGNPVFATTVSLFTNRHAKEMTERQIHSLGRICEVYHQGFYIADLPMLRQIVEFVSLKVSEGKEAFVEPLCRMLETCGVPFVKETASEEYRNFEPLCDMVRALGKELLSPNRAVQLAAGSMLVKYASASEGQPATISYHHQVMEHSTMCQQLVKALVQATDVEVFDQLLRLVLELSRTKELAAQLVASECLPTVIGAFGMGFKSEAVALALEALWNIVELVPECTPELCSERSIGVFKDLFNEMITEGHRVQDKEIRNQLLVLLTYCIPDETCHPFFASTGLLEMMMNVAFALESEVPLSQNVKHFVLTNSHEDFEMKRTLMHLVCKMSNDAECISLITSHPSFVPGLVLYIDERIVQHPARRKFTKQQERLLQVQSLACLFTLVQHCPDLFMELEGCQIVLEFMTEQSEETLRSGCLKLLVNITGIEGYPQELGGRCVAMMLSLIRERGLHPLHIRQDAMCVLARLCWGCHENQTVVGQLNGVGVVVANLDREAEDSTLQSKTEPMVLSALDATWAAVVGHPDNEVAFDEEGGVWAILNLLEASPVFMHSMIVSCLCDLLENRDFVDSFRSWRSAKTKKGVVPLMLGMWDDETARREEQKRLRVEMREEEPADKSSSELVENLTGHNLHTKLHAALGQLEFITEEKLTGLQQRRLLEIERYIDLEDARVWKKFSDELLEDGIRPVTPDHRRLHDRFRRDSKVADDLEGLVEEVEEREDEEVQGDLERFYRRVHLEQHAKNSTARRVQGAPTSTRTKIIVDSHKAQVFPALINPLMVNQSATANQKQLPQPAVAPASVASGGVRALPRPMSATGRGNNNTALEQSVDQFLGDETTARIVNSRPNSRGGMSAGPPVGSAVNAAAVLRAK